MNNRNKPKSCSTGVTFGTEEKQTFEMKLLVDQEMNKCFSYETNAFCIWHKVELEDHMTKNAQNKQQINRMIERWLYWR